ncbi:hypothetical protein D3C76_1712270 [compost metagenome]
MLHTEVCGSLPMLKVPVMCWLLVYWPRSENFTSLPPEAFTQSAKSSRQVS